MESYTLRKAEVFVCAIKQILLFRFIMMALPCLAGPKECESKTEAVPAKEETASDINKAKVIKSCNVSSGSAPSTRKPLCNNNQEWLKQKPAPGKGICLTVLYSCNLFSVAMCW